MYKFCTQNTVHDALNIIQKQCEVYMGFPFCGVVNGLWCFQMDSWLDIVGTGYQNSVFLSAAELRDGETHVTDH